MTASEAKTLAIENNRINKYLLGVLKDIKSSALSGGFFAYISFLDKRTIVDLEALGYKVKIDDVFGYKVYWGE